ncbi:MAG: hypothetical protein WBW93_13930 [Steroidobacteraceae bacterium]
MAEQIGNKNDVVIVGCKLPHGLWAELTPPPREAPDGQVRTPPPAGQRMLLKGANSAASTAALGGALIRVNPRVLNYGRTIVSREFWERWAKQETAKSFIDKGFIFAEAKEQDFKAQAREQLPEKTGLEGLSPEGNDERMKTIRIPGQPETVIEPDKEHLKRLQRELTEAA